MRVTGGLLGGRTLRAPPGLGTRPTADRVRQALFNILGAPLPGARVLDLYAGSGALGIEALSRGAESAVFVEQDRHACLVLKENLAALGLTRRAALLCEPVERALARLRTQPPFDWLFADPPYEEGLLPALLARLGAPESPFLHSTSLVIVEHPSRGGAPLLDDAYGVLRRTDSRCYGQTALSFYASALGPAGPRGPADAPPDPQGSHGKNDP